ncbi:MAG: hypothetical protein AB1896_06940 [Thermodesulfobacteriota bacterium]
MIAQMKKVTFIGLQSDRERFLKRLQEVGLTHLIIPGEVLEPAEAAKALERVTETLKFLDRLAKKQEVPEGESGEVEELCTRLEELKDRETRLQAEWNGLKKELIRSQAWGEIDPADVALLRSKGLDFRFFRLPRKEFERLSDEAALVQVTGQSEGEVAFVAFSAQPLAYAHLAEKDPQSPVQLAVQMQAAETELAGIRAEYTELSQGVPALKRSATELKDNYEYEKARLNVESGLLDRLFVLRCWSPLPEEELIQKIGPDFVLYHMVSEPEPGDRVPVLLENPPVLAPGEDLVKVYSHPGYSDFDPSGFVLYCFAVFLGMIIGDAGYGLFLLGLTVFIHFKVKRKGPGLVRFLRLSFLLSLSVIFFGVISVSYFGISIGKDNFLSRLMLLDLVTPQGQRAVMLISIIMGMVHITLSLAIKLVRQRDLPSLGWIIVIWSGYFVLRARMTQGAVNEPAQWVMIAGLVLVLLFTSSSKNPIIRFLAGLNGVLGIIQVFSDVLSYLRLFALGLATVYISQTVNMLAGMAVEAVPWLGFVLAGLILLGGHAVNLLLGVMSGVIHGLRLNFLEWYRWCFEGDGLPFRPFKLTVHPSK